MERHHRETLTPTFGGFPLNFYKVQEDNVDDNEEKEEEEEDFLSFTVRHPEDASATATTETHESQVENVPSPTRRTPQMSDVPDSLPYQPPTAERQEDRTDAKVANKAKPSVALDAECYNMNHARRGIAIIFNNVHFTTMPTRKGAVKDAKDLTRTFEKLGFTVRYKEDPTYKEISDILEAVAAEDHTDADCLVLTVMSHGSSGRLHSAERTYSVEALWSPFTGDHCTTLIGKPKLIFIQACRGENFDHGVTINFSADVVDGAPSYTIPNFADIMVAYSTYDGYYSWRNPDDGSWFIQAICEEFNIHGGTRDLLTLMTFVNRRVAINYRSYSPYDKKYHGNKQIPSFVSMLTRLVYFPEKQSLNCG